MIKIHIYTQKFQQEIGKRLNALDLSPYNKGRVRSIVEDIYAFYKQNYVLITNYDRLNNQNKELRQKLLKTTNEKLKFKHCLRQLKGNIEELNGFTKLD